MGSRLLFAVAIVVLCTSSAFAGPQLVISDPLCTGSDIPLVGGSYSFTFTGQNSLTFCNTGTSTLTSLNFTISAGTSFDLGGFYCGAPDAYQTAAFDYCLVLDPTQPNSGNNNQLFGGGPFGVNPTEKVVHQFVTDSPIPVFGNVHDGPTKFYQQNQCFFGCQTNNVGTDMGNVVNLSFNILDPLHIRPGICLQLPLPNVPCGLLPGHQFTLTFACDQANTDTGSHPCTDLPIGAGISFQGSPNPDQVNFPAAVPEPTTLLLLTTGGVSAFFRRRKKS